MKCNTKTAALLAACLILGACSQNNGAAAPAESTTTSATEAEVTTTEAATTVATNAPLTTTTSAATTTTVATTTERENYGELIIYPVRGDQVHNLFDYEALEIFELKFYGLWKYEGESDHISDLQLRYSEDYFDYGHACYPCNIVETDELYALTYICGGELSCYAVFKNEPDVLYDCGYNLYNGNLEGYEWAVYINSRAPKYTDRHEMEMPFLRSGKLSNLGTHRLQFDLGEDFTEFYNETLLHDSGYDGESYGGDGYIDENGTSWLIVSSMAYPRDTRYLVSYDYYSNDSVTIGIPYYEKREYEAHDYLGEDEEVSWKKYFALEFTKKDGKWQVTHRPLEDLKN